MDEKARIEELEKTLRTIYLYAYNIERIATEADKVMCGTGQIKIMISRVHPRFRWPEEDREEVEKLENDRGRFFQAGRR
jgi:hypothetical protein